LYVYRKWNESLDELMSSVVQELSSASIENEEDKKFKLSVVQGFVFQFYIKIYQKLQQKLVSVFDILQGIDQFIYWSIILFFD